MAQATLDLSVLLCTRNRAESLKITLDCLLASYRPGLPVEIVLIDNGSEDETPQVAASYKARLPIRYLREDRLGKVHGLNRALDVGGLGRIIAEIDDDMTVEPDWFQGVLASCKRHPDADIFGGHVYIIWPPGPVPAWVLQCRSDVIGWAFSAYSFEKHVPKVDRWIRRDRWPCGNHFWFRSRVLKENNRFADLWETAPGLLFDFVENGSRAVVCPDVAAGHRIQPQFLDETFILNRASMMGWNFANIWLRPHRPSFKLSGALSRHPIAMRVYFLIMLAWFQSCYRLPWPFESKSARFERRLFAAHRVALYREMWNIANTDRAYREISAKRIEHYG